MLVIAVILWGVIIAAVVGALHHLMKGPHLTGEQKLVALLVSSVITVPVCGLLFFRLRFSLRSYCRLAISRSGRRPCRLRCSWGRWCSSSGWASLSRAMWRTGAKRVGRPEPRTPLIDRVPLDALKGPAGIPAGPFVLAITALPSHYGLVGVVLHPECHGAYSNPLVART